MSILKPFVPRAEESTFAAYVVKYSRGGEGVNETFLRSEVHARVPPAGGENESAGRTVAESIAELNRMVIGPWTRTPESPCEGVVLVTNGNEA